eukprot:15045971-Ditylum_brightwellii.AAC.1
MCIGRCCCCTYLSEGRTSGFGQEAGYSEERCVGRIGERRRMCPQDKEETWHDKKKKAYIGKEKNYERSKEESREKNRRR